MEQASQIKLIHFGLKGMHVALDIHYINRVISLVLLERIPNAKNYMAGLMNFSGVGIPVIDLALLLNLPRDNQYKLDTPIIICKVKEKQFGLIVDQIFELVDVASDQIQMKNEFNLNDDTVNSVVKINDTIALLLSPDMLLKSVHSNESVANEG